VQAKINGFSFFVVAALTLSGCAADPSTGGSARSSAATDSAAKAAVSEKPIDRAKGYRRMVKNGTEYFCRRESTTGSRTDVEEVCMTQAQMDAQRDNTQDLLRRMNGTPAGMQGADSSGGVTNGVMGR
jgi:hypothetical protein